jgi:type I restriction enzyme M protein
VRLYGQFEEGPRSKIFDNADFGYTRVTVERPLRLRYQMTSEDKARFLDACPHLLDDVQAIDKALGRDVRLDWAATWAEIEVLLKTRASQVEGAGAEAVSVGVHAAGCEGRARARRRAWFRLRARR